MAGEPEIGKPQRLSKALWAKREAVELKAWGQRKKEGLQIRPGACFPFGGPKPEFSVEGG